MIQIDKIVINNFLSWGENQVIFLRDQGIVRVEGNNLDEPAADSNMAGKSSIVEAVLWCFYGRTIRNVKHDAVVNRFSNGGCYVTIFFHVHSDVLYRVTRYRRHSKHKNSLLFFRGASPLAYRHGDDTQAKLESVLGCDYESFTHTTIFGGPRSFALLTDAEQKKILESFLHFEKFEIALRRTKDLLSEVVERRHQLEIQISTIRERVQEIRNRLGSLSRADRLGKEESKQERAKIKRSLQKLSRLYSDKVLRKASREATREVEVAGEVVEILVASLAKARAERKTLHQRLELLSKSLRDREKLRGKPCPVCGQRVSSGTMKAFLSHLRKDEKASVRDLKDARTRISKVERRLLYARRVLKRVQKISIRHTNQKTRVMSTRRELEAALAKSKKASTPFTYEIQKLSLRYSKEMSRLLVLQFEERSLIQKWKDLTFWIKGFGNQGVKALIIKEALPAMNRKMSEYAGEIYGGTAKIQFVPTKTNRRGEERELFHLRYKSRFGSNTYLGESSGGRRRVDICVLLVFSWLSSVCNLLFVDELLDGLDSAGRESVLSILGRLRGTVLVISHKKELKARFQKVWTVVKKHGISHLEKAA